jgi:hypothetical protein
MYVKYIIPWAAILLLLLPAASGQQPAMGPPITGTHSAIRYLERPVDDPVARLSRKIASGEVKLEYDANRWGYLPSLLQHSA